MASLRCSIGGVPATATILDSDELEIVYGGTSSTPSTPLATPIKNNILPKTMPLVRDPQRYKLLELFGKVEGCVVTITTNDRVLVLTSASGEEASAWSTLLENRCAESENSGWELVDRSPLSAQDVDGEEGKTSSSHTALPALLKRQNTIVVKDHKRRRTFLTLEDNVITYYRDVDRLGLPRGREGKIKLMDVRAVHIRGNVLRIDTTETSRDLEVESPGEAQVWARLVEDAMEQWARQEQSEVRARINLQLAMDGV